MIDYYKQINLNLNNFKGQFVLSKNLETIPEGWTKEERGQWFLGTNELPVKKLKNLSGQMIGWCIGYPVNHNDPWNKEITIQNPDDNCIDIDAINKLYEETCGRFIVIAILKNEAKLFLDPYGSMGAVYSEIEQTVASTPTLFAQHHDWDKRLIHSLNMPERDAYFPLGMTPKQGVKRLLPNHFLDLDKLSVHRHWPMTPNEIEMKNDEKECIEKILSRLSNTVAIISKKYSMQIPLTAGKDSRMILACAREYLNDTTIFTFSSEKETLDTYISTKLAKKLNLQHKIIPFEKASEEEKLHWLYLTGHSVSGAILKIHKSLNKLDPKRVYLNGLSAEIGRMKFWKEGDHENTKLTAEELITRCSYPQNKRFMSEMENWLSELSGFNAFNILDLCHIEQRLGCWASPQHYGFEMPIFEIAPFNQRIIFRETMKLPYAYRKKSWLAKDICSKLWPELLELPFNEYVGIKKYQHKMFTSLYQNQKKAIYNTKRAIKRLIN